jgi:hypothetical protein
MNGDPSVRAAWSLLLLLLALSGDSIVVHHRACARSCVLSGEEREWAATRQGI